MRYLLIILVLLSACSSSNDHLMIHNLGFAQGTTYSIKYLSDDEKDYQNQIDSIFEVLDVSMSTYIPSSLISKINNGQDDFQLDTHFIRVFKKYKVIAAQTDGLFDCSVYPVMKLWDFDANGKTILDSSQIQKTLDFVGYKNLDLVGDTSLFMPKGFMLDFNAIAQGYTVDVISNFLDSLKISNYLVEVGGELRVSGVNAQDKIWRVGIDKPSKVPDTKDRFQIVVELYNKSLATSGNYRKFYVKDGVKYSHTINPKTGFPVQHSLLSASVIADECISADAYATAFMVMGVQKTIEFLKTHQNLHVFLIYSDNKGQMQTWSSSEFEDMVLN
jgi:FAD:protein FMN transferase